MPLAVKMTKPAWSIAWCQNAVSVCSITKAVMNKLFVFFALLVAVFM